MKKVFALLLALMLLCSAALADAELKVMNTMCHIIPYYDSAVGVYYAEVVNTGDTLICLDDELSRVELMDSEGNVVLSEEIWNVTPTVLAPGEKGYVVPFHMYLDEVDVSALTNYAIHLYAEEATYFEPPVYLNAAGITAEIRTEPDRWGNDVTALYITFTNMAEDVVYDFNFAVGVYDESGALIYTYESSTYDVGVPAGQSVIVRSEIDNFLTAYWAENGIVPASIGVIGYQN